MKLNNNDNNPTIQVLQKEKENIKSVVDKDSPSPPPPPPPPPKLPLISQLLGENFQSNTRPFGGDGGDDDNGSNNKLPPITKKLKMERSLSIYTVCCGVCVCLYLLKLNSVYFSYVFFFILFV